jgi:UDP-GlcNAc:undecaprenyl-phosphate GlcNAc-1-phosphate transferase
MYESKKSMTSWFLAYLYVISFSFLLSLISVYASMKLALRYKLMDDPGPRKLQVKPIPLLGGVGIFVSFYLTILFNFIVLHFSISSPEISRLLPAEVVAYAPNALRLSGALMSILWAGVLVFIVGLIDDWKDLGAWPKLAVHIVCASILFFSGIRITFFTHSEIASYFMTVIWVVGITNAFNLLDNMDGLSSGVAVIANLFLWIISIASNEFFVALFLSALMGAILGFWVFNFPPARIFMGDAGSYLIGFLTASVTILGTYYQPNASTLFTVLMPVLVLGVPIYDLLSVILIRLYEGRSIFQGDKQHFSHRIVDLGMSKKGAVFFLYLVSFAFGTSSLILGFFQAYKVSIVLLQTIAFVSIIALLEYFGRRHHHGKK